jgi:peptidoglycan/LPS O-acetylase OafA/YrhL
LAIQRPTWLPSYLPEFDGLRGLAILWVVLYHCDPLLKGTWIHYAAQWGWAGVDIFFVLSGFLITTILVGTRDKPHYFHNFHARRALRIWPVYVLVLAVVYLNAPWFIGPSVWGAVKVAPWLAYIFFVQNLFHLTLPPAIGPTWALAVEEQYYFAWAPLVRFLRRPWMLAAVLTAALIASPLLRLGHHPWLTPTHTLIHLDGIALGSLMALGLYTIRFSRRVWLWIGLGAFVLGIAGAATVAGGTAFLDSALALGFAGAVLAAMTSTGARNPVNALLRHGPLAFYGRISYGLYMTHIMAFIFFGWFDLWMVRYGMAGNLAVVAVRLAVSTALAAGLWYGFESKILKLKRYF